MYSSSPSPSYPPDQSSGKPPDPIVRNGNQSRRGCQLRQELAEKMKLPQEEPHGLPKVLTPEHTFHYTYAVFHSPVYRIRYGQLLKPDFPAFPSPGNLA